MDVPAAAMPLVDHPVQKSSAFAVRAVLLLAAFAAVATLSLQAWLGPATIYSLELEPKRMALHQAILTNTPPPSGWAAVGAASLNIRVTAVYAAEVVHNLSGLSVNRAYWLLDTVFLFAVIFSLPIYLRRWLEPTWCLVGVLYFTAVLPLTYFMHAFQPWDRMQLAAWLLLLALIRDQRPVLAAAVLALSMTIKFDTVLIAMLYGLAHLRRDTWARTLAVCGLLAMVGYASLTLLKVVYPATAEPARFSLAVATTQLRLNVHDLASLHVRHPVLLAFGLPAVLALMRITRRPRYLVAGVIFGTVLTAVWAVFTVYAAVRTQVPLLLLLLPPALLTLRELLQPAAGQSAAVSQVRKT